MVGDVSCRDCQHCQLRDVFNGYCEAKYESVLVDSSGNKCPSFRAAPKCKFCQKYVEERQFLGKCNGRLVYPDLSACSDFRSKDVVMA